MANPNNTTMNLTLQTILEKDKLTRPIFRDWERNLQIVLRHKRKRYVLELPLGEAPSNNANAVITNAHKKFVNDLLDVQHLMLATMSLGL